jgi:hypothetical protein
MNNWTPEELTFRCDRLSVRLERLATNFLQISMLSHTIENSAQTLSIVRESKSFLELTAVDLDFDNAFELAQIQRQLSHWHRRWEDTWNNESDRTSIATHTKAWADKVRAIAGVLV